MKSHFENRKFFAALLVLIALAGCTRFKQCAYEGIGRDEWQKPDEVIRALAIRPGIAGIRVSRGRSGVRLEASVQFGRPGLGFRGVQGAGGEAVEAGLLIVGESVYRLWTFAARASTRLVRLEGWQSWPALPAPREQRRSRSPCAGIRARRASPPHDLPAQ